MALEGLTVSIGSRTRDVQRGLSAVRESLQSVGRSATSTSAAMEGTAESAEDLTQETAQLALGMYGLAAATDSAEDELEEARTAALTTSSAFSALSVSTSGLSASVGALGTSLTVGLIGTLAALSTMIAPLVAGLGGMAAALTGVAAGFGLVLGTGAVSHFEELKTAFSEAKQEIQALFAAFGEGFGPMLVDAVEALPTLVRRILEAVGPLDQFQALLREFGGLAMDAIPALVSTFVDLGRVALPVLQDFVSFLMDNGDDALNSMLGTIADLAPEVSAFIDALIDGAPVLLEVGTTVASVVVPAVTALVEGLTVLGSGITALDPVLQQFTVTVGLVGAALLGLGGPLSAVTLGVAALAGAWASDMFNIRSITTRVMADVGEILSRAMEGMRSETNSSLSDQVSAWKKFEVRVAAGLDTLTTKLTNYLDFLATGAKMTGTFIARSIEATAAAAQGDTERARQLADSIISQQGEMFSGVRQRMQERNRALSLRNADRRGALSTGDMSLLPGSGSDTSETPQWVQDLREDQEQRRDWQSRVADIFADIRSNTEANTQAVKDSMLSQGPCDLREQLLAPFERAPRSQPRAGPLSGTDIDQARERDREVVQTLKDIRAEQRKQQQPEIHMDGQKVTDVVSDEQAVRKFKQTIRE